MEGVAQKKGPKNLGFRLLPWERAMLRQVRQHGCILAGWRRRLVGGGKKGR